MAHIVFTPEVHVLNRCDETLEQYTYPTSKADINTVFLEYLLSPAFHDFVTQHDTGIFGGVLRYAYDRDDNLLHIWYDAWENFTLADLQQHIEMLDPEDGGVDGWMAGSAWLINDADVVPHLGFVPVPYKAYRVLEDSEVEIDISQFV